MRFVVVDFLRSMDVQTYGDIYGMLCRRVNQSKLKQIKVHCLTHLDKTTAKFGAFSSKFTLQIGLFLRHKH